MSRSSQPSWRRLLIELPFLLIVALLAAWLLKSWVSQAYHIPSGSMQPQLEVGDRVMVSRLAYRLHDPRRGDIVVFHSPSNDDDDPGGVMGFLDETLQGVGLRQPDDTELIKRIVGLPGEVIEARAGRVLINGRELVEPYLRADLATEDFGPVTVPDDHVFVLGDNRLPGQSADSRSSLGPVPIEDIVGRAIARVWPPGRWANL